MGAIFFHDTTIKKSICIYWFLVYLSCSIGIGQQIKTVIVNDDFQHSYPDSERTFIFEDKLNVLTASGFLKQLAAGHTYINYEQIPYLGKTSSSWWVGMRMERTGIKAKRLVVEVDFVYIDNLDFYLWENGALIKTYKGFSWKKPSLERPIPHRVFAIDFETRPNCSYVWALRAEKADGVLALPIRLFDYKVFEHVSKINYNTHAISIGVMFLAIIMGLALFFTSKAVMYAYYSGYIFSLAGMVLGEQGYFNQYLLWINELLPTPNVWIYFMATGIFCHVQFSLIFLTIDNYQSRFWFKTGKVLSHLAIGLFILSLIPTLGGKIYELALILGICFNFLNITFIIIAFRLKNPVSLFYLIAVAPFTMCAAYICFSTLGLVPENWIIFELFNYGPVWEILVLSILVCFEYQNRLKLQNQALLELSQAETIKLKAVNEAQEADRQRIARELHDSVGSLVGALKLNWDTEEKSWGAYGDKITIRNLLEELTKEVRRVSHELMPSSLATNGIVEALEQLYSNHTKPVIRIIHNHYDPQTLLRDREILLFRIIQELITNSLRHAKASEISVQLVSEVGKISLLYEDDGKGLPNHDQNAFKGMGYQNISSRLSYLGGKMELQSSPNRGFLCLIEIPV